MKGMSVGSSKGLIRNGITFLFSKQPIEIACCKVIVRVGSKHDRPFLIKGSNFLLQRIKPGAGSW
jgi:hypothetical protein